MKLLSTGLGSEGEDKTTFISEGESYSFSAGDFDPEAYTTLGVRATSVNGSGSIKWVDKDSSVGNQDTTAPTGGTPDLAAASDSGTSDSDDTTNDTTPSTCAPRRSKAITANRRATSSRSQPRASRSYRKNSASLATPRRAR